MDIPIQIEIRCFASKIENKNTYIFTYLQIYLFIEGYLMVRWVKLTPPIEDRVKFILKLTPPMEKGSCTKFNNHYQN